MPGGTESAWMSGAGRRIVAVGDDGVSVRLRGRLVLAALRRRVFVPYARLQEVSTEPFDMKVLAWRVAGLAFGRHLHGLFRRRGAWLFLSFHDRGRVVHLRMRREPGRRGLDEVVVGVDDPAAVATEIGRRAGLPGLRPR